MRGRLALCLGAFWLVAVSVPAFGENHPGPAGLEWGMSAKEAREHLSNRYKIQTVQGVKHANAKEVEYLGEFAGFSGSTIVATMYKGKFIGLTVILPKPANRPLTRTWAKAADMMQEKYGPPDRQSDIPDSLRNYNEDKGVGPPWDNQGVLLGKIIRGELNPKALWRFDNQVVVSVLAQMEEVQLGPQVNVTWSFSKLPRMRAMAEEIEQNEKDAGEAPDF